MQLIRKIPFVLGWSVFYLSTVLLTSLLRLWFFPFLDELFPRLIPNVNFISLMVQYVVIGFFTFTFSVSKIALPLYRIDKIDFEERTQIAFASFPLRWILYLVYSVVYSIPLIFVGILPTEIGESISLTWTILASFLAYRGVVHSWVKDVILNGRKSNENRAVIA